MHGVCILLFTVVSLRKDFEFIIEKLELGLPTYVHINLKFYNFSTENTTLTASSLENCQITLTCKHHERNDVAFNPKATFWRKNNGSFVEYSEGVVKSGNEETVLYITAEYGDTFTCALKLQNGGMEESNAITVQRPDEPPQCEIDILYIGLSEITYIHTCTYLRLTYV